MRVLAFRKRLNVYFTERRQRFIVKNFMEESKKYVTLIEVGKKQNYIFSSNRLSENVGASIIIRKVTEEDTRAFYKRYSPEIVYEGGGKALYVFADKDDGISFARKYSRYVMEEYPGLVLSIVGYELMNGASVKEGVAECYRLMEQKKNRVQYRTCMIDFGSTLRCAETNLPAVPHDRIVLPEDRQQKPISAESITKYKYSSTKRNSYFSEFLPQNYQFPDKTDLIGRSKDEKSYIAIVHIDGNRMSNKISKFNEAMIPKKEETRESFDQRYIRGLKNLSNEIDEKYKEAFRELVSTIVENLDKLKGVLNLTEGYLPIRPLIMAGDDICFASDGRIGVDAARIFLENIQRKQVQGIPLNACGGVAIVKSHFPFSRAYDLAEALCRNAKNAVPEDQDASFIDWHIEQGELKDSLRQIRDQYKAEDGSWLTVKPYRITGEMDADSFRHFEDAFDQLTKSEIPRSKIIGMRDVAYKGKTATEYYLKINQIADELHRTNWKRGECGFTKINGEEKHLFFDAMEMLDMYVKIEDQNGKKESDEVYFGGRVKV